MNSAKPQILLALLCLLLFSCREYSLEVPFPGTSDTTGNGTDTTGGGGVNLDSPAVFTLVSGTNGSCANVLVLGAYVSGVPLTISHTITLEVMVATPGQWDVTSATVNGMFFSNAGVFTGTGLQTITLLGAGIPGEFGTNVVPVAVGGSNCAFAVTVSEN
ncbi:hypothetical protein [Chitinophaga japonensis]|uniref:Lipoprotein n=1 Tax=Chitinophaga japonensis TaxID=104662 RepID=A0A562SMX8_CHIJA|nr:hypothetical protein [Chitinophaga japonensis]TWI82641.1 hypothetical protein LX66_5218 [Chitinophaga japonensis]